MGNKASKADFADIAQNSRLDEADLRDLLKTFNSLAKDGYLNKDQLKAEIEKKYGGMDSTFANILFNLFDRNGDKMINFNEFCLAYGYLVNRSLDDVVDISFKCIDLNGDGHISRDELRSVIMMNRKMERYVKVYNRSTALDKIVLTPRDMMEISQETDDLFKLLDEDKNKQVSRDEFIQLANTNPEIKKRLCALLVKDESVDFFKK
ncbi:hypothetical protein SAMD00019534_105370 [Acytostelium subglobosum LB1]|uniref:hypothetical protein n=1 Tax=Acytostelium subglobosum LB1 TaxID=1410327 RepID=UPI0006449F23|nr:hypothetical protein SAMD00019534_105370 [Acytostelium subglobosum LB1]GAM27362.1 hypothetical protein SAMD00019534_105370 [Acytostelium subglobosum LB1]|eukprot:XP_012749829.1 hypothetical protein SAMD00019534_105370 [Acytostelium subglobosum LB1]